MSASIAQQAAPAALPPSLVDRTRDLLDRLACERSGALSPAAVSTSALLASVAGRVERLPPLTRGEDPSTHHDTAPEASA